MVNKIIIHGTEHPFLKKMYAIRLWEDKYGNISQLTDSNKATTTAILYFAYACIANGYFYLKQAMPMTFDEFLCDLDETDVEKIANEMTKLAEPEKKK